MHLGFASKGFRVVEQQASLIEDQVPTTLVAESAVEDIDKKNDRECFKTEDSACDEYTARFLQHWHSVT